ncbi:MAG: M6 family metalloprotease domain-containing protein [Prevotella sp.]|nr:M6 family metalloprotease domain-containing protein [Prevotella sp.]
MKKLVSTLCLLLVACATWAAKAYPGPITVTQSDGSQLVVLAYGDEDYHWFTTTDQVLLAHVGADFFVARIDAEGKLIATAQLAHEAALRSTAEKQLVVDQIPLRQTFMAQAVQTREAQKQRRIGIGTTTPSYFPHLGTPRAMVILVQYADMSFSMDDPYRSFNDYLNGEGALPDYGLRENRNHGSVSQFFSDMSEGAFRPQFDVFGPVTLSQNWNYYGQNSGDSDQSSRITELMKEACTAIDDTVDFSQYDSDGDKNVDLVYVIYAGYSESMGAPSDYIWPKSGTLSGGTYDGVNVKRYGVNNELNYTPDYKFKDPPYKRMNGIGLFCHEFSHTMGLPDFYPTSTEARKVDNQSMEYWDIMDGGEYTDRGYTPTPYTPWEKEVMEWTTIPVLSDTAQVTLQDGEYLKILPEDATSNEYVILHNSQSSNWQQGLAALGHGMLVYRVDYTNANATPRTSVNLGDYPNNTAGKPGFTLIPADSLLINYYRVYSSIEEKSDAMPYSNDEYLLSHAGDTYPGKEGVTKLDSMVLNRTTINKPIYNIKEEDGVITFDFLKDYVAADIRQVENGKRASDAVYDLQGRKIANGKWIMDNGELPKGVYIQNGNKFVVK